MTRPRLRAGEPPHPARIEALAADVNTLRQERGITFEQAYDAIVKPAWVLQYKGAKTDLENQVINKAKSIARARGGASSSLRVAIGTRGEIIESRRWKNARTGATASIYGAVPWTRQGDRDDWEVETVGYTIQWEDGTIGIGRAPFPTREEAEAWLERDRTRRAGYGATPWRGGATAPAKRRSGRVRDGDDEDEVEMWIDAQDNEAPWLAQHWHSSQGDPLYALGSTGFPQPESTISWALSNAKKSEAFQWAEMEKKYGKKRLQKLMAIDPESREARAA